MKLIYSNKLQGSCSRCHAPVQGGGFLSLDANGTVIGMLCKECRQAEEVENNKGVSITVKKLEGSFVQFILKQDLYQIISCKNLLFRDDIITGEDLNKYIANPNVTVTIKY